MTQVCIRLFTRYENIQIAGVARPAVKRDRPGADDHILTFFVVSKRMNSRRSFDNGRIDVLRQDQFKEDLQIFIAGQSAVVLIVSIVGFCKRGKFSDDRFHQ